MKNLLCSITVVALLLSCSRGNDNSISDNQIPNEGKKILVQIIENNKPQSSYKWEKGKVTRIDYYKDGFLETYTKITYSGHLRKIDSIFDTRNTFLSRTIYSYDINDLLVLVENPKKGYFTEKRRELLRQLNLGYIGREEYLKEIENLKSKYTPKIKELIAKIPYPFGSREYQEAVSEIERTNDAPYREAKYAYDRKGNVSEKISFIEGNKNTQSLYTYSNDRKHLDIKYINTPNPTYYYKTSLTFDGKKGILNGIYPNKADYFYNTIEWKLTENTYPNSHNMAKYLRNFKSQYTYDNEGYPITENRIYEDGEILKRVFVWK